MRVKTFFGRVGLDKHFLVSFLGRGRFGGGGDCSPKKLPDGYNFIGLGPVVGAAIKGIHFFGVPEPDGFEHSDHGFGFFAHVPDGVSRPGWQEGYVDAFLGKQAQDKFLVVPAEFVRILIFHVEESSPDGFP